MLIYINEVICTSKIVNVCPNDDYTLSIEFEEGSKIIFNMQRLIKTMQYSGLRDIRCFKDIKYEEKSIYWEGDKTSNSNRLAVKLTLDNILFSLRD